MLKKRNCLVATLLLLLTIAFFGAQSVLTTAMAQTQDQQIQTDAQAEAQAESEPEAQADADNPLELAEELDGVLDSQQVSGRFIPTEEISQDLGVSFPVDI